MPYCIINEYPSSILGLHSKDKGQGSVCFSNDCTCQVCQWCDQASVRGEPLCLTIMPMRPWCQLPCLHWVSKFSSNDWSIIEIDLVNLSGHRCYGHGLIRNLQDVWHWWWWHCGSQGSKTGTQGITGLPRASGPLSEADTRDLDDPAGLGEVWSWLIVMDSEFLPSNLGIGLSHGDDVGWFFSSGFLFCLFSQELLNSAHPHFEVQPNWSTSWHLSRRKALQRDKWSMLIRPLTACLHVLSWKSEVWEPEHRGTWNISSWRVLKIILQASTIRDCNFNVFFQRCIVLVCSGQLFSTSVITTADSARMSIQDATETSWPDDLWHVLLENSVHCEFLYSSVLSVSSIHETWGFLGSLYHGVLCDKQCRPSKVVWLLGSRKQNHQDNQIFLAVD